MNYYRESTIRAALKQFFSELDAAAAMRAIKAEAEKCPDICIIDSDKLSPNVKCKNCARASFTYEDGFVYCTQGGGRYHEPDDSCEYRSVTEDLPWYDDHTVSGLLDD